MQSSTYTPDAHTQADGRRYVTESFVDDAGGQHSWMYLAPVGWGDVEYTAHLAMVAARIDKQLAKAEFEQLLGEDVSVTLNLKYQTAAQFAERLRERWRNSTREECARIAWWIRNRIVSGDVTQAQLRTAFGMTQAQWNALRDDKLIPLADAWQAVRDAAGE